MSAEESRRYCATLAKSHYENFHVVSFLLPKKLHQDFFNVYAYCRISDDLGDEVFASTIQASLAAGEAPPDELDDAEIERSIREINEAIQRSAQRKP